MRLLSGILRCGRCGATMGAGASTAPVAGRYSTYVCRACFLSRKAIALDAYVISLAMTRLGRPDAQSAVLPRDQHPDAESLAARWGDLTRRRSELSNLWVGGVMPIAHYQRHSMSLAADLTALEERLADLRTDPATGRTPPGDPAYALVGASLSDLRTVIAKLFAPSAHQVRPGR